MKSRQLVVAAGLATAALALAPAALAGNHTVQIAGKLVAPNDVSATQLAAGTSPASRLVQIGGKLVRPENISATEQQLSSSYGTRSGTSGSDSWWKISGISVGALAFALLVAAMVITRRPVRAVRA